MSRQFLLTKFVCTGCGKNLSLEYTGKGIQGQHAQGEPTGAEMVHTTVGVHPCSCQTQQLEEIRRAAKTIFGQVV